MPPSPRSGRPGRTRPSAATTCWPRRSAATCPSPAIRTGRPPAPPRPTPTPTPPGNAGRLCAFGIVPARHYRQRTGRGQRIDLALLDSLIVALDNLGERYTVGGEILTRAGNVSFSGSATGIYPTTARPAATPAAPG